MCRSDAIRGHKYLCCCYLGLSYAALDTISMVLDNVSTAFGKQSRNGFSIIHNLGTLLSMVPHRVANHPIHAFSETNTRSQQLPFLL